MVGGGQCWPGGSAAEETDLASWNHKAFGEADERGRLQHTCLR